jgi:hypothetical protein
MMAAWNKNIDLNGIQSHNHMVMSDRFFISVSSIQYSEFSKQRVYSDTDYVFPGFLICLYFYRSFRMIRGTFRICMKHSFNLENHCLAEKCSNNFSMHKLLV